MFLNDDTVMCSNEGVNIKETFFAENVVTQAMKIELCLETGGCILSF